MFLLPLFQGIAEQQSDRATYHVFDLLLWSACDGDSGNGIELCGLLRGGINEGRGDGCNGELTVDQHVKGLRVNQGTGWTGMLIRVKRRDGEKEKVECPLLW